MGASNTDSACWLSTRPFIRGKNYLRSSPSHQIFDRRSPFSNNVLHSIIGNRNFYGALWDRIWRRTVWWCGGEGLLLTCLRQSMWEKNGQRQISLWEQNRAERGIMLHHYLWSFQFIIVLQCSKNLSLCSVGVGLWVCSYNDCASLQAKKTKRNDDNDSC